MFYPLLKITTTFCLSSVFCHGFWSLFLIKLVGILQSFDCWKWWVFCTTIMMGLYCPVVKVTLTFKTGHFSGKGCIVPSGVPNW